MKVIFISGLGSSDSDFPLIREMISKGVDVITYIPISRYWKKGVLFNISKQPRSGILPASRFMDLDIYKDYLDLNKVFIINDNFRYNQFLGFIVWGLAFFHMLMQKADIIHYGWPRSGFSKIVYHLPGKKVHMVHDPIVHSDYSGNKGIENDRMYAFAKADKLVLLSTPQINEFKSLYNIPNDKILVNKMGDFNVIASIKPETPSIEGDYILYFGYIHKYKGIDLLCQAFKEIKKKYPNVKLVIAGGGKLYFDWNEYKYDRNFILINRYITVPELAGLLKGCMFSVCPYIDATQSGAVQTAFSMNVPLIVTNVGALPNVVNEVGGGVVIPASNIPAIISACEQLIEDKGRIETYRSNIKEKWNLLMDWKPIAERYINCYKDLIYNK